MICVKDQRYVIVFIEYSIAWQIWEASEKFKINKKKIKKKKKI